MATEKNITSRVINKHDIEANWNKATTFIPKPGEIIIYDADETHTYARVKIGDGDKTVIELPFYGDNIEAIEELDEKIESYNTNLNTEISNKADQDNVYTKAEIDGKLTGALHYRGSKNTFQELLNIVKDKIYTPQNGDVWNIAQVGTNENDTNVDMHGDQIKAGDNVIYIEDETTSGWDVSSGTTDLSDYYTKDEINASLTSKTDKAFANITVGTTTISADLKADTLTLVAGNNITITPDATNDKITITATDTNTHYTSKNVVGSSIATANTTSALTNGNVYLNSVENGAVTSSHKISGSGATTVTTDTSGNIIITSPAAAGSSLGLVKSGGDVTISDGVITVNDNSHNHSADNITSGELATARLPIIPATKGGTGETTLKASANTLINALPAGNTTPHDEDYYVSQKVGGGTTDTAYYRRPMSLLWNYIKDKMTGGISSVITTNFSTNRAIISDADGKLKSSAVTSTELGYLAGVSSSVQTQIDTFVNKHQIDTYTSLTSIGLQDASDMVYNESDVEASVVANLLKIFNALPYTSELRIYGYSNTNPNLWGSLLAKRNADLSRTGTSYALNMTFVKNSYTTMDILLKPTYTSICDEEYRCIFRYDGTDGVTSTVTVMTCPYDTGNKPTANDISAIALAQGTTLEDGTDLDTVTEVGNYKNIGSSRVFGNCPVSGTLFIMRVGNPVPGYANYKYQEIITINGRRYYRYATPVDGVLTWQEWMHNYDTKNKPTAEDIGALAEKAPVCSDCDVEIKTGGQKITLKKLTADSANSPNALGLTSYTQGTLLTYAYSTAHGIQYAFSGGTIFERNYANSTLGEWNKFATFDNVYSLVDATELSANANLNEITDFGNYFASSANAKTFTNCPVEEGFVMHIERSSLTISNDTYRKQKIVPYNTNQEWWRSKTSSTNWTAWQSTSINNPNLLDNWYWLDPVNNRGKTSYSGPTTGFIDRWYAASTMEVELTDKGIKFTNTSTSDTSSIVQYTTNGYRDGTYTASILITETDLTTESTGSFYFSKSNNYSCTNSTIRSLTGTGLFKVTNTISDGTFNRLRIQIPAGKTITIAGIKLEEGTCQTLAEKNKDGNWIISHIPNKREESLKCSQASISTVTDVYTGYSPFESYSLNAATAISAGTDLNTLTFGNYYCSSSNTKTVLNIPEPFSTGTGFGFVLKVERITYSKENYCKQRFMSYNSPVEYWRINKAGVWSDWMSTVTNNYTGDVTITGAITGTTVKGAVWNDYAEYRESNITEPGRVICENGDDTLSLATERLQPGANVISDTFGFAIGETETAKTPIAVSGRVLVYPYEDRDTYKPGDAVCAAPNGTVSKMTREEIREYPERIIGTVSAIPNYETWGTGNVSVNGRIWIKVK